ncbi:hypothetical protein [Phaeobacter sp. B1627]|uniref:hypothetical protein n=1 Tax=Phaeobacter sp. B1627 TaxID=2583809 RepID=UPI001118221A|nr:hypothetical protein [Phaeobacter sp. B1627]TNJ41410.1 hypothetical protein FGE21_14190 [Phaeobacter sp. B1627]
MTKVAGAFLGVLCQFPQRQHEKDSLCDLGLAVPGVNFSPFQRFVRVFPCQQTSVKYLSHFSECFARETIRQDV